MNAVAAVSFAILNIVVCVRGGVIFCDRNTACPVSTTCEASANVPGVNICYTGQYGWVCAFTDDAPRRHDKASRPLRAQRWQWFGKRLLVSSALSNLTAMLSKRHADDVCAGANDRSVTHCTGAACYTYTIVICTGYSHRRR
jgi:hypothetical protein